MLWQVPGLTQSKEFDETVERVLADLVVGESRDALVRTLRTGDDDLALCLKELGDGRTIDDG